MYADRMQRRRLDPTSFALALVINGALVTGLVLSAPTIIPEIEPILEGTHIPLPPPPPEPEPRVVDKQPLPRSVPRPHVPDRVVATDKPVEVTLGAAPMPPLGPVMGNGGGGGVIIEPVKLPPVLVGTTVDPRFAGDFQPLYPAEERRAGRAGRVVVRVLIGVDGRVREVERVAAASEAFFEATRRRALQKWRFKPATRDGIPHEVWRTMNVSFVLEDE